MGVWKIYMDPPGGCHTSPKIIISQPEFSPRGRVNPPNKSNTLIEATLLIRAYTAKTLLIVEGFSPRLSLLLGIPRVLAQAFSGLFWGRGPGQWPPGAGTRGE